MPENQQASFIVLMGVSGSGKTTVGRLLADRLGWRFYDGDEFHSEQNVAKMAAGIPLSDTDRAPWLARLNRLVGELQRAGQPAVLACSALKSAYRWALQDGNEPITFVFLHAAFETLLSRMKNRAEHYMKAGMLRSQFETLEPPTAEEALRVKADRVKGEVVEEIIENLGLQTL